MFVNVLGPNQTELFVIAAVGVGGGGAAAVFVMIHVQKEKKLVLGFLRPVCRMGSHRKKKKTFVMGMRIII